MAGKSKESSLLFSANNASPFDDISSTPILFPPSSNAEKLEDKSNSTNPLVEPILSLQPHLQTDLSASATFKVKEQVSLNNTSEYLRRSPQIAASIPPPKAPATSGSSFLRRPISKYVVPPEINSAPLQSQSPHFTSAPSSHITAPFIPPTQSVSYDHKPFFPTVPNSNGNFSVPATIEAQNSSPSNISYGSVSPINTSTAIIPASFDEMASNPPILSETYHPVMHHWFYGEGQPVTWKPFSFTDSLNLEDAHREGKTDHVSTDGGRYDVDVLGRRRVPVYWDGESQPVMRCSWFRRTYNGTCPIPFSEEAADKLEAEYRDAIISSVWNRQVELSANERAMINSPTSMYYYQIPELADIQILTSPPESSALLTIRRGTDDFVIKEGASDQVDHLLFLIHGIGSACDLSFRSVEECVDDFRTMGEELLSNHFKEAIDCGKVGRVEILPISWHKALHGDATGLDAKLKHITLRSIPKFREFTNDTLLDVLFYTSPVYCQHIMDTVASEMDRLLCLFCQRNTNFNGSVSVGGHSLGSVILFDLLMHQNPSIENDPAKKTKACNKKMCGDAVESGEDSNEDNSGDEHLNSLTSQIDFHMGVAGTGQPVITYPQLSFKPKAFFLMGSPVGMFITVRGIDQLGPSFKLPTCDYVFNIFHPFDPVAYRIETLIDTSFEELRPVLVPHHKGRKRMHLELKDTIERVGSDIKNKIVDSIQSTWNRFYQLYSGSTVEGMQEEVDQALEEHISRTHLDCDLNSSFQANRKIGELNRGERIDYVLQEKPYESLTEYIFALQAHVSYWKSEDTLLMILKELYKIDGISCDSSSSSLAHQQQYTPRSSIAYSSVSSFSPSVPHSSDLDSAQIVTPDDTRLPLPPVPLLPNNVISSSATLLPVLGQSSQSSFPTQQTQFNSTTSLLTSIQGNKPKTLRGRPLFDPFSTVTNTIGMDPTATPCGASTLPPPPILPNVCFNQKKINK